MAPGPAVTDREVNAGPASGLDRLLATIIRARFAVLLASLVLTAAGLHQVLTGLSIDTDTTEMISPEAAFRRNHAAYLHAFPQESDRLILVLDGPSAEATVAATTALMTALRASPNFPDVWVPGGAPYFRRHGLLYLDTDELAELSERMAAASPFLGALAADPNLRGLFDAIGVAIQYQEDAAVPEALLRRVLLKLANVAERAAAGQAGQLSWRRLFDPTPRAGTETRRIIVAQPRLDFTSLSPAEMAVAEARRLAEEAGIGGDADVRLRLTGQVALEYEELRSAEIGGKTAAGLSFVLVLLLLGFGLRSVRLILAALLTLGIGLIWTGAFAALAIGHLNLISVAFAVLFVGLGVDFSIHFCLRYREEVEAGGARDSAIRRAGLGIGRGLAIAALGAGLGFYAFLPTDYRGFAELGLISGTGMFIAFLVNFTVLPALLAVLPGGDGRRLPRGDLWYRLDRFVARRRRQILIASLAGLIAALGALPRLNFDVNPLNLKDPESESFTTFQELARDSDSGVYAAEVLSPSLRAAQALADRLADLKVVRETRTIADFVPEEQAAKLSLIEEMAIFLGPLLTSNSPPALSAAARGQALDDLLERLRPVTTNPANTGDPLASATARLERALSPFVDEPSDLARLEARLTGHLDEFLEDLRRALQAGPVDLADLPASLTRHWIGRDGSYRIQVLPAEGYAGTGRMGEFVQAVLALAPNASGTSVTVSEAGDIVVTSFGVATLIAVAAIALLLLVLYRRLDSVALSLAPLALAAVLTLATAAAFDLALNFANIIVLPLLFGLGIASTVHLVERRRQLADTAALMRTTTPRAVTFSTLTTLASFGSLAVSAHRGMSSMGELLTIAILYMLLCTLVVLPSLMPMLARGDASAAGAGTASKGGDST